MRVTTIMKNQRNSKKKVKITRAPNIDSCKSHHNWLYVTPHRT
jgi:hypothetical protein